MDDITKFVQGKLQDFENTAAQTARGVGSTLQNIGQGIGNEVQQLPNQINSTVGNVGRFIGQQPIANTIGSITNPIGSSLLPQIGPTINQATNQFARNSALNAFTSGQPQKIIPNLRSTTDQINKNTFGFTVKNGQPVDTGFGPTQATNVVTAGNIGGFGESEISKAAKTLNRVADPDTINAIKNTVANLQTKGAQVSNEELRNLESVAANVYGDSARYLKNSQLANLMDATLKNIGATKNDFGLGLRTSSVRPEDLKVAEQKAVQNAPQLNNLLNKVGQETGAQVDVNLKNPETAVEKVAAKQDEGRTGYSIQDVNDMSRGRLTYPDKPQLYASLDNLKQNAQSLGWKIGKEEDLFKNPDGNYQAYHIDLVAPNGQKAEVQLHTQKSLAISLATHDLHAAEEEGQTLTKAQADAQGKGITDDIKAGTTEQAAQLNQVIKAKNAPNIQEGQVKALRVANAGLYDINKQFPNVAKALPKFKSWEDFKVAAREAASVSNPDQPFGTINVKGVQIPIEEQLNLQKYADANGIKTPEDIYKAFTSRVAQPTLSEVKPPTLSAQGEPLPWETNGIEPTIDRNPTVQTEPEIQQALAPKELKAAAKANRGPESPSSRGNYNTIQDVLGKHFATQQDIEQRSNILINQLNQAVRNPKETELFRNTIEHPENLEQNAKLTSNPTLFSKAVKAYQDFTDYTYQQLKANGADTEYIEDYYSHILDLSDPKIAQKFQDFIATARNTNGFYNKNRIFANIDELRKAGFELKNPTVQQDVLDYANTVKRELSGRVLSKGLKDFSPNDVYTTDSGEAPPAMFTQLKISGAKGTYVNNNIYDQVKHLEPQDFGNLIKGVDTVNNKIKNIKLAGGGFHAINTALDYVGTQLFSQGKLPRLDKAAAVFISPNTWNAYREEALGSGLIDKASQMGVTLSRNADITPQGAVTTLKAKNPITWLHQATFDRLINFFKLETVKNIDTTNLAPEEMRGLGKQINNIFSGQNQILNQRNKVTQLGLRFLALASDYQEGRFRRTLTALNPTDWSKGAMLARTSLAGRIIVTGVLAELGRRIVTGKFDNNIQSAVQHAFLDPSFPLPYKSPTGKQKEAVLPASNPSDISRAIQDPQHFLQSHLAAIPSMGLQYLSNKDYYGNPLAGPNSSQVDKLKALAGSNLLPIPAVQGQKILQNKTDLLDAAVNVAGLRTRTSKDDPSVVYMNNLTQAADKLNQNDKNIFLGVVHPSKTDQNGNPIIDKNNYITPDKYETLLAHPNVLAAEEAFQKSQPNHDPFWDWSPAQQKAYMQAQIINANDPGGDKTTVNALYNAIPPQLFNARTQYFNQLQQSGQLSPQAPNQYKVQTPVAVTQFWNQYFALPAGSAQRKAMLSSPLGQQALALTQQQSQLTNQQRLDMGLPLLAGNTGGTSGGSSGLGYGGTGSSSTSRLRFNSIKRQIKYLNSTYKKVQRAKLPITRKSGGKSRLLARKSPIKLKAKSSSQPQFASVKSFANPKTKGVKRLHV